MQELIDAVEYFVPGMSKHVYVIKFERITPDLAMLCFTTRGTDETDYYWAILEYDYLDTIKYAKKVISGSFAKVQEFHAPQIKQKGRTELEQRHFYDPKTGKNYLFARTERPKGNSYWATSIIINPGDLIDDKLKKLSSKDQLAAKECLLRVISNYSPPTDGSVSFLEKVQNAAQYKNLTINTLTQNNTNYVIAIFKNVSGGWEAFFNRQRPPQKAK